LTYLEATSMEFSFKYKLPNGLQFGIHWQLEYRRAVQLQQLFLMWYFKLF